MPDGTLFPGWDGSPGEVEPRQDITHVDLDPLYDDPEPSALDGLEVDDAGVATDLTDQDADTAAVVDDVPRVPQPARRRTLKDRIALLTRQRNEERDQRGLAEHQLQQLTQALIRQGEQIERIAAGRSAPPQTHGDVLDSITDAPAPQGMITPETVEQAVSRAIQQYDSQLRAQQNQSTQLQLAQDDSYTAAVEDMPELGDNGSPAAKAFAQLWQRSPLRALPDGPYQVALQVQGLLAAEQAVSRSTTARKRQASVAGPAPTATDELGQGQLKALQAEYERVRKQVKNGIADRDTLFKFRKLGRALGRTKAPPGR